MWRRALALTTAGLTASALIVACDDADRADHARVGGKGRGDERVGVILPDADGARRWQTYDARYFREAFDDAGVPVEMANADGDERKFQRIGDAMIDSGVRVLIITSLDSASGRAVLDRARRRGVSTIDYDRLTLNGGADFHVGFDDELIGRRQAHGLINCLSARKAVNPVVAVLNGSQTDYNAVRRKAGYDSVLQPKYDAAAFTEGPDQWVPDGNDEEARRIFEQMLAQQPRIGGVVAADDGIANVVIEVLRRRGLSGTIPVTGHDATVQGLRNLLTGEQCVTVYRRIRLEAQTAATLAIQLFEGGKPMARKRIKDPESGASIPFFPLEPFSIDVTQVKEVVADGLVTRQELCTGRHARLCTKYGVVGPDGPR